MTTFDYTTKGYIYHWLNGGRFCDMDLTLPELDDIAEGLANIAQKANVVQVAHSLDSFLDYRKQYVFNITEASDDVINYADWVDKDFKTLAFLVDEIAYRIVREAGFIAFVNSGFKW